MKRITITRADGQLSVVYVSDGTPTSEALALWQSKEIEGNPMASYIEDAVNA